MVVARTYWFEFEKNIQGPTHDQTLVTISILDEAKDETKFRISFLV